MERDRDDFASGDDAFHLGLEVFVFADKGIGAGGNLGKRKGTRFVGHGAIADATLRIFEDDHFICNRILVEEEASVDFTGLSINNGGCQEANEKAKRANGQNAGKPHTEWNYRVLDGEGRHCGRKIQGK